ncbi:EAL domain-containing response regulator [Luteimonas sp. MC1572]|uniref:EAL domain-containing protein n=1 Tax=Luteimonas sp. MC1572 TaxID=2799325 RepID=UPI001F22843B|nr:EAL domain-containing response regulator [Luteimonas sp. MC1572]
MAKAAAGIDNTSARGAATRARAHAAGIRAEFPPPQYWRRWCADAGAPLAAAADAPIVVPVPAPQPQVGADGSVEAPYRVLVVEDDLSQGLFAESVLGGAGMEAAVVSVATEVMASLESFRPDLVLMDLHMPGMDGVELTNLIRGHDVHGHVPIVFLTGDPDPERQFEVLEVGADDFLTKPVRPRHLIAAVQSRVRRARMLARQRDGGARHPVTGLFTRSHMLQLLNSAIPGDGQGAIYMLEVAGIGALRDRYGYAGLEQLLTDAGGRIAQASSGNAVSRLSDSIYLIHAAVLPPEQLPETARILRDALGRHVFPVGEETVRLQAFVGYTTLSHAYGDASSALAAAERALREARGLPASIAGFQPPPQRNHDQAVVESVRQALLENRFELAFQPVVAVAGGDDAQYQTLLRMRGEDGRLHAAAEFLPAADAADLMHEVDRRVLELAVDVLHQRSAMSRPVRLFVSQSARTLARERYADHVVETLAAHGGEGGSLVIDVRQDEALIHTLALKEFCAAMVPAGIQLCLSQYHASREADALLTQLPLGYVRLAALYSNRLDDTTVRDEMRHAIERAHRLGLQVIGPQVEDPQAAATLWMSGVDYIQGNLVQQAAGGLDFDFHHSVL